jgi:hypothetical protein
MPTIKPGHSIVTEARHPVLFRAMMEILLDNGRVNRIEPAPRRFDIPPPWASQIGDVELALSELDEDALAEFCAGEQREVENKFLGDPEMRKAGDFLDAFANEWMRA